MSRKDRARRRPLFEIIDELCAEIAMDEDPKSHALLALGAMVAMALKVGWTLDALSALHAWPRRAEASETTDTNDLDERR